MNSNRKKPLKVFSSSVDSSSLRAPRTVWSKNADHHYRNFFNITLEPEESVHVCPGIQGIQGTSSSTEALQEKNNEVDEI